MKRAILSLSIIILAFVGAGVAHAEQAMPRILYSFYDKAQNPSPRFSMLHRAGEMPLNYLGFHIEYYEINDPLPQWRDDVAGLILWLPAGSSFPDTIRYLDWIEAGIAKQKKMIFLGDFGFKENFITEENNLKRTNEVLKNIGLTLKDEWANITYNVDIVSKDSNIVEYERTYFGILPSFNGIRATPDATSHLHVKRFTDENVDEYSDLVITHKNGGYAARNYEFFYTEDNEEETKTSQRWLINPFKFFRKIFIDGQLPIPDATTLTGKRIFYSHIDGDGWNNVSEISEYSKTKTLSSEVMLKEILQKYPHIPFTVAPIVNDLRTDCYGLKNSKQIAIDSFALNNVEPASHTYSHPLLWRYFEHYNPLYEVRFLEDYPELPGGTTSIYNALNSAMSAKHYLYEPWKEFINAAGSADIENPNPAFRKKNGYFLNDYVTPRSYACEPFDMKTEINGSLEYMDALAPASKKTRVLQWSGDTNPSESALRAVREAGGVNINGGDSRFDPEYPSYSYVAPIGLKVGNERQIYSSNSNENTYTELWNDRFYGFKHLVNTVENTESPRRVSPFNIYYHLYSAQKRPSLEAVKQNLNFALSQDIIPVFTSDYIDIANGFFATKITPLGAQTWRIEERGKLDTVRFDNATLLAVDFDKSEGVIGQKHFQGSLYVALAPNNPAPIVALKESRAMEFPAAASQPYIISSRMKISHFEHKNDALHLKATGIGTQVMQIYWPFEEKLMVTVKKDGETLKQRSYTVNDNHNIKLILHDGDLSELTISLVPETL
jgi:polysaccharide biosynthesis protein PelA